MPYEHSSAKKKRIILSTHRKANPPPSAALKQTADSQVSELRQFHHERLDAETVFNCASINNSLEIFDEDPRNRHFQFLDHEQEKSEPALSKDKNNSGLLQTMPSSINMHKKINNLSNKSETPLTKIHGTISLTSLHSAGQIEPKKTAPFNRRFIDLTLKKDLKRMSHQASASQLPEESNRSCMTRSNIFETERSILSSISVNSVQFTVGNSVVTDRKKILTITCHKYQGVKGKKAKTESISKCNSIRLLRKCN